MILSIEISSFFIETLSWAHCKALCIAVPKIDNVLCDEGKRRILLIKKAFGPPFVTSIKALT